MEATKTFLTCLLILIPLSFGLVASAPDGAHAWIHTTQQLVKRGEMQYCGSRLVEAVRNLCQGNYAALTRRSDPALANMGISFDDDGKNILDKMFSGSQSLENASQDLDSDNAWDGQDNSLPADFETWPKNTKSLAFRIFPNLSEGSSSHHRIRRSVIEECCKRPCGVRTMLKYCGSVRP